MALQVGPTPPFYCNYIAYISIQVAAPSPKPALGLTLFPSLKDKTINRTSVILERPGEWIKALPTPLEFQIGPGEMVQGQDKKCHYFWHHPEFSHCLHASSQPTFLPLSCLPPSACSSGCSSCSPSIWSLPPTSPRLLLLTLVLPAPTAQPDHEGLSGLRGKMERAELGHIGGLAKVHPLTQMLTCRNAPHF